MLKSAVPKKHLFQIENFCNIINVFTVISHHFDASLQNKSMNSFKKILVTSTFWTVVHKSCINLVHINKHINKYVCVEYYV